MKIGSMSSRHVVVKYVVPKLNDTRAYLLVERLVERCNGFFWWTLPDLTPNRHLLGRAVTLEGTSSGTTPPPDCCLRGSPFSNAMSGTDLPVSRCPFGHGTVSGMWTYQPSQHPPRANHKTGLRTPPRLNLPLHMYLPLPPPMREPQDETSHAAPSQPPPPHMFLNASPLPCANR
jgi:hypothetical protein